jgi:hypothetical protein
MCFNVVLPNLSLAFSSVMFYQTSRILLTPITAVLNYTFYGKTIARQAAYTLIPVCVGVGIVSYYDTKPGASTQSTSFLGVFFALTGVFASSVYTVWIGYFHKKLEMTSHQLLHNQSLCGAVALLYFIPFVDTFPIWSGVALSQWLLILFVSHIRTETLVTRLISQTERVLCCGNQLVTVCHYRWSWSRCQYCGRPLKDSVYCGSGLAHKWTRCNRYEPVWCCYRCWWDCALLCCDNSVWVVIRIRVVYIVGEGIDHITICWKSSQSQLVQVSNDVPCESMQRSLVLPHHRKSLWRLSRKGTWKSHDSLNDIRFNSPTSIYAKHDNKKTYSYQKGTSSNASSSDLFQFPLQSPGSQRL